MRSIIKMPSDDLPPDQRGGGITSKKEEGQCEALLKCLPAICRRTKGEGALPQKRGRPMRSIIKMPFETKEDIGHEI